MTQVEICNLALGWIGAELITSIDDGSTPARLCKSMWASTRDVVTAEHEWGFASKRAVIAKDATPPAFGWENRFAIPTDSLRLTSITNFYGDRIERAIEGAFILANEADLYVVYQRRVETTADLPAYFGQALAARLASDLAVPLQQSENLQATWLKIYRMKVAEAAAIDGTQGGAIRVNPAGSRFQR